MAKLFLPDNTVLINFARQKSAAVDPKYFDLNQAASTFGTPSTLTTPNASTPRSCAPTWPAQASPPPRHPRHQHIGPAAVRADNRDLIGQAKGVIKERCNVDAIRAFEMLRELPQTSNEKLVDVAQRMIATRGS